MRLAIFGGIYSNSHALRAAIADARGRGAERLFCLGDLGAFGPHPDRVFPLLFDAGVDCLQGNYDDSVGNDKTDCQCGYTDPRDNDFAQLSYDYTWENTSRENRRWLRTLPTQRRLNVDGLRILLCHGSPRRVNEFLWESTTSTHFLEKLARDHNADLILGTHTGIHWHRELSGGKRFVNVGVLGRPENDGHTNVWYALLRTGMDADGNAPASLRYSVDFIPLEYDYIRLAQEMRDERLPEPFIETILTGWWTTCLEVLPARERGRGRY
jgi:predicted phosphodiesterase